MSLRDDLRTLANRPLDSSQRGLMIGCLALLVAVAIAAVALGGNTETSPQDDERADSAPQAAPPPPSPAPPAGEEGLDPPSEEEPVAPEQQPSREDVDAARSATRRVLDDYLRYSYGRADADEIDGITEELRRELDRSPPRVPARVRERDVEVVTVTTESVTSLAAEVLALVDDGEGTYSIRVDLQRDDDGWVVTAIDRA